MDLKIEALAEKIRQHPKLVIADDYEIAIQKTGLQRVRYVDGQAESMAQGERCWVSVRILHRKRGGRCVVLNPSWESLADLVEGAFESANRASVDPWFRFPLWKAGSAAAGQKSSPLSYDSMRDQLPPECSFLEESYDAWATDTLIRRKTERVERRYQNNTHWAAFKLIAKQASGSFLLKEQRARQGGLSERENWLKALCNDSIRHCRPPHKSPFRGLRRVVFGPRVNCSLLEVMAPWFFADEVQNDRSPLSRAAFGPSLTLLDEGDSERTPWGGPFDLEGVPCQRTVLVAAGAVQNQLHDVYSATRENRLSTGNFLRPSGELSPRIRSSLFYVAPGQMSGQQLLEQMSNGVYWDVLEAMEPLPGHPGRYWLKGRGWRVLFGQCAEPLQDIQAEIDLPTFFQKAVGVANDLEFFAGFGSPSIFIEEMPLGL